MIRFADATAQAEMEAANTTPKGKRSVRHTVRGSLVGYVSGRMWINFGDAYSPWVEREAQAWLDEA